MSADDRIKVRKDLLDRPDVLAQVLVEVIMDRMRRARADGNLYRSVLVSFVDEEELCLTSP